MKGAARNALRAFPSAVDLMERGIHMRKTKFNPPGFHLNQIPMYLVLVPLALFMSLPILFIINHAIKPIEELFAFPPR